MNRCAPRRHICLPSAQPLMVADLRQFACPADDSVCEPGAAANKVEQLQADCISLIFSHPRREQQLRTKILDGGQPGSPIPVVSKPADIPWLIEQYAATGKHSGVRARSVVSGIAILRALTL